MARMREPIGPRIFRSVNTQAADECWLWQGSKTKDGYGVLTVGRKQVRAHRASYEEFNGAIPSGAVICLRCDTPLCVNPRHLFAGEPKDNTRDMISKSRQVNVRGAAHPNTKITPEQRDEIRQLRADGLSLKAIADRYGVNFRTISAIITKVNSYGTR